MLFIVNMQLTGAPEALSMSRARGLASLLHLGYLFLWVIITVHVKEPADFLQGISPGYFRLGISYSIAILYLVQVIFKGHRKFTLNSK